MNESSHPAVSALQIDATMRDRLVAAALEEGFDLAGVAGAPAEEEPSARHLRERFLKWIDEGHSAEMAYLKRANEQGEMLRSSLHAAMPWARSVLVCAVNYNADAPRSIDPASPDSGWIARYAWSGTLAEDGTTVPADYHDLLLGRLRRLETKVHALAEDHSIETRCYVDTGPIVERHFAEVAGIGWTGKNTCLINQEQGSWFLLGVIVTSLPLAVEAALAPAADRCGTCTRCIDACPTDALLAPRQMDAGRCIAYLTIEKKGSIPEELREPMGRQIFGCDICQDVCPWNRKAPVSGSGVMHSRKELINPVLEWIAGMDNAAFKKNFRGSPLERTGRKRLHRNTAIAMGNSGDARHLARLQAWTEGPDEGLAESSRWAMERIRARMEKSAESKG